MTKKELKEWRFLEVTLKEKRPAGTEQNPYVLIILAREPEPGRIEFIKRYIYKNSPSIVSCTMDRLSENMFDQRWSIIGMNWDPDLKAVKKKTTI